MNKEKSLFDYFRFHKSSAETAVETEKISISGANENVVQHSSLFYQPFAEKTCQNVCAIFEAYNSTASESSRRIALNSLERMLSSGDDGEIPNIECLLYASRVANSKITNDMVFFDTLATFVAKCYSVKKEVSFDVVKHIFKTWNWNCQVGLALIGSIEAEDNAVKRGQLFSEMEKYLKKHGDTSHRLLLYKVKAMILRKGEYASQLADIISGLTSSVNNDTQIATIVKQNASSVFKGNEDLINIFPQDKLAKNAVKDIKQILGYGEPDNLIDRIKDGNENEEIRKQIFEKMARDETNVERYCAIIRKNRLMSYLEVFDRLLNLRNLKVHHKCCIALTYSQMAKSDKSKFIDLTEKYDLPLDFIYLLKYVFNSNRYNPDYLNLKKAVQFYFSQEASQLLKQGIIHTSKYDENVAKLVIEAFAEELQIKNENTDSEVLLRFDMLLKNPKSSVCEKINKSSMFLALFDTYLKNSSIDLDRHPDFFDALIDIIDHCPKTVVKGFWYKLYSKTRNSSRKARIREKMGDPSVIS